MPSNPPLPNPIGNKTTPAILLAPVAVIKDNIKQTVIKDGF